MKFKKIPKIKNIEKFLSSIRIDEKSGCWNFSKATSSGYGYFMQDKKVFVAHRISFSLFKEKIINKNVIDHKCKNRRCVNPDHLRQVTSAINVTENSDSPSAINKLKTHCKYGHALIGKNLMIIGKKRKCRTCTRARGHLFARGLGVEHIEKFFYYKNNEPKKCKKGHILEGDNIKPRFNKNKNDYSYRSCLACYRAKHKERVKL